MKFFLLIPLLAGLATPAYATASLDCHARETNIVFNVDGTMGMDDWAPIENLKAEVLVPRDEIAEAYQSTGLDEGLIQRWIIGDVINLHFHRFVDDGTAIVTVDARMETKLDIDSDDQAYNGIFHITYDVEPKDKKSWVKPASVKTEGSAVCFLQ